MIRLNFEQLLAEEPNMGKVDGFLITIIILIAGVFVIYKTAEFQFSGVQYEKEKNKILLHQIEQLKLKDQVSAFEKKQDDESTLLEPTGSRKRNIASLGPVKSFKFAPIDSNKELLDSSALAESFFNKAKLNCEKYKKEDVCTQNIDIVLTQFPETRWAGESLLLLSRLYMKTRHLERAREVLNIVRREFKYDKDLQSKLAQVERAHP